MNLKPYREMPVSDTAKYRAFSCHRDELEQNIKHFSDRPFRYETKEQAITAIGLCFKRQIILRPDADDWVGVIVDRDGKITLVEIVDLAREFSR